MGTAHGRERTAGRCVESCAYVRSRTRQRGPAGPKDHGHGWGWGPHLVEEAGVGAPAGPKDHGHGWGWGPHLVEEAGVGAPAGPKDHGHGWGWGPHLVEEAGVGAPAGPKDQTNQERNQSRVARQPSSRVVQGFQPRWMAARPGSRADRASSPGRAGA